MAIFIVRRVILITLIKRFTLLFICALFVFSSIPVSATADTGLVSELAQTKTDGASFNFGDWPRNDEGSAAFITIGEVGYSATGTTSSFALYLYVYNPTEKAIVKNGKNAVTMATAFDKDGKASTYSKFSLEFVEASANNRFFKFKILDPAGMIKNVVRNYGRIYLFSELELHYLGTTNAESFKMGRRYEFSGTAADGNLSHTRKDIEVIQSPVTYTYFRTATSDAGVGHQNQLNSVYFTVPNRLLKPTLGGQLSRIKVEWTEQKTAPVFVVKDDDIYSNLMEYVGIDIGQYSADVPFTMISQSALSSGIWSVGQYVYNEKGGLTGSVAPAEIIPLIAYVFETDSYEAGGISVSSEDLKQWIYSYQESNGELPEWLFYGSVDEGREKGWQSHDITLGVKYDLISYTENMGEIRKWFYEKLGGVTEESYKNLDAFYYVKASDLVGSDEDISERLCVNVNDVSDLKNRYTSAIANNETLVLFRYAETDYFTEKMVYSDSKVLGSWLYSGDLLYFFQETVFLDWDMIELEFDLNGEKTVVPYVMSPQDHIADGTNPDMGEPDLSGLAFIIALLGLLLIVWLCRKPAMVAADAIKGISDGLAESIVPDNNKKNKRKRK